MIAIVTTHSVSCQLLSSISYQYFKYQWFETVLQSDVAFRGRFFLIFQTKEYFSIFHKEPQYSVKKIDLHPLTSSRNSLSEILYQQTYQESTGYRNGNLVISQQKTTSVQFHIATPVPFLNLNLTNKPFLLYFNSREGHCTNTLCPLYKNTNIHSHTHAREFLIFLIHRQFANQNDKETLSILLIFFASFTMVLFIPLSHLTLNKTKSKVPEFLNFQFNNH